MKLANFNPFIPKGRDRDIFIQTFFAERRIYRRRPPFWIGLTTALVCSLALLYRVDTVDRLLMLPIIFGMAVVHDTITSHFTKRLIKERRSDTVNVPDPTKGEQAVDPNA